MLLTWFQPTYMPSQTTVNVVSGSTAATMTGIDFDGSGGDLMGILMASEGGAIACRQGVIPSGAGSGPGELWIRPRKEDGFTATVTFDDAFAANTHKFASIDLGFIGPDLVTRVVFQRYDNRTERQKRRDTLNHGEPPVITDGTSKLAKEYGDRLLERRGLFNATDDDVRNMAAWIIGTRAKPRTAIKRLTTVPLVPGANTADDAEVLGITVLDEVIVKFTPPGGSQHALTHEVRQVQWEITPEKAVGTFDLIDPEVVTGFVVGTNEVDDELT